jgi:dTDP-4-dehydrorhamnose reductase
MDRVYDIGSVVKADLRAAVDAIDQWADDNASAFNSAIPQPARSSLNSKQKAALLMLVVARRHGVL